MNPLRADTHVESNALARNQDAGRDAGDPAQQQGGGGPNDVEVDTDAESSRSNAVRDDIEQYIDKKIKDMRQQIIDEIRNS